MRQRVQLRQRLVHRAGPLRRRLRHVVPDDQLPLLLDPDRQLVQLQRQQSPVRAQFDHVLGDLGRDPADHFQPLRDRRHVADRDQVLDLQRRQRARDLVEAQLVPLQRGQRLVRPRQDRPGLLQDPPLPVHVQRDQPHRLRHRHHREAALLGDAVGRTVARTRLLRVDRRVRHQLHTGPQDLGDVLVEDERAVELAQLAQSGRRELHVQDETARAHGLDALVHTEDDEPAGVAANDPLQAVTQRLTRCDRAQRGAHHGLLLGARARLPGCCCPVLGCHCTPPVAGCAAPRRGHEDVRTAGRTSTKSTGARHGPAVAWPGTARPGPVRTP